MTAGGTAARPCGNLLTEFRPETFADLVGQTVAVTAFKNMIKRGAWPTGILVSGEMGSGKTVLARVMATALSCTGRKATSPEPCGACPSCRLARSDRASFNMVLVTAASQVDPGIISERVLDVSRDGLLWAESRTNVLFIDDIDCLNSASQRVLRAALDRRWPNGILIATSACVKKLDAPMRERMSEFQSMPPSVGEAAAWIERLAASVGLQIEDEDAPAILARNAGLNLRCVLRIMQRLLDLEWPVSRESVVLVARQMGYAPEI